MRDNQESVGKRGNVTLGSNAILGSCLLEAFHGVLERSGQDHRWHLHLRLEEPLGDEEVVLSDQRVPLALDASGSFEALLLQDGQRGLQKANGLLVVAIRPRDPRHLDYPIYNYKGNQRRSNYLHEPSVSRNLTLSRVKLLHQGLHLIRDGQSEQRPSSFPCQRRIVNEFFILSFANIEDPKQRG